MPEFTKLTSVDPTERLELSSGNPNISMRVLDVIAPIGKGQRGLIVAPPKTGKTTLIEEIAEAVADNHPETHLVVLLVDERPEEVTHLKRRVRGEVIASSADQNADYHLMITHLVHERVKRMVECKQGNAFGFDNAVGACVESRDKPTRPDDERRSGFTSS
jgi:transcription termination factor Rho